MLKCNNSFKLSLSLVNMGGSLIESDCKQWIDEMGKVVTFLPALSNGFFYIDEGCRELRNSYNPYVKARSAAGMGSANMESFVNQICGIFPVVGEFVGFEKSSLLEFAKIYQNIDKPARLIGGEYLRERWIMGTRILFPEKKLVELCFDYWPGKSS